MLCEVCASVLHVKSDGYQAPNTLEISASQLEAYDHHVDRKSFERAVETGCYVCRWFNQEHKILDDESRTTINCEPFTMLAVSGLLNIFRQELSFRVGLNTAGGIDWSSEDTQSKFDLLQLIGGDDDEARSRRTLRRSEVMPIRRRPDQSVEIARRWLRDCTESHSTCKRRVVKHCFLPTRLIDVSPRVTRQTSKTWRLVDSATTSGIEGYATLSHCWGSVLNKVLEKGNIKKFQAGLSDDELPPKYRDTLQLIRALGLRYVWIDSLCIMQDSEEDWLREGLQMHEIYTNSLCTIAACFAKDSSEHFLTGLDSQAELLQIVRLNWTSGDLFGDDTASASEESSSDSDYCMEEPPHPSDEDSDEAQPDATGSMDDDHPLPVPTGLPHSADALTSVVHWEGGIWGSDSDEDPDFYPADGAMHGLETAPTGYYDEFGQTKLTWSSGETEYLIYHENFYRSSLSRNLLASRAWCFQELMLSPRVIYCAEDQLFWECRSLKTCEAHPTITIGSELDKSQPLPADLFRTSQDVELPAVISTRPTSYWHSVVQGYTRGNLTKGTDKLIAIAGVAKAFQATTKMTYLAGLWQEELPYSLLWFVEGSENLNAKSSRCVPRAVPYRGPSWSWCSVDGVAQYETIWEGVVIDLVSIRQAQTTNTSSDAFGQITRGYIEMNGVVISAASTCSPAKVLANLPLSDLDNYYTIESNNALDSENPQLHYVPLVYVPDHASLDGDERLMYGLLLLDAGISSQGQRQYSRAGMFCFRPDALRLIGIGELPLRCLSNWPSPGLRQQTILII